MIMRGLNLLAFAVFVLLHILVLLHYLSEMLAIEEFSKMEIKPQIVLVNSFL